MENQKSRVYVLINDNNVIVRIEGEYTLPNDLTDWILVEEGEPCDRLNLAQTHYLEKGLTTNDGIYQYKYIDNEIVERTEAEIEEDRANIPHVPSEMEQMREQMLDLENIISDLLLSL